MKIEKSEIKEGLKRAYARISRDSTSTYVPSSSGVDLASVNASNLKDSLKNKRYWFSRHKKIVNRGIFDHWPMGRGRYTENLTGVIGTDFYGDNFQNAKFAEDFDSFINEDVKTFANNSNPEMREAYSLLNNGFNSRAVLGKLRDAELNESATKNRIETYVGSRVAAPDTDNWAILGLNEPVITPKEYANLLKAEMIVSNPIIEQDALENGADRTFAYSETAGNSYEPPVIMGDKTLNKYPHMAEIENFGEVLGQISQHAKVRFIGSDVVEKGQVEFIKRRFYGPLRTIKNFVKKSGNAQSSGLPSSYTLKVSNQNTQGEQLYMIMKSMAELSVRPFVEETSRICGTAENLPSRETFEENRKYIERASACLVASDMCKMFNLSTDDARVMSDYFKIEAAQNLGQITETNSTTIMPLIADYYAESINSFAQDFGISIENMAKYDEIDATSARNLGSVLYARHTPQTTNTLGESNYNATRTNNNSTENDRLFEYLRRQAMRKKEEEAARGRAREETIRKLREAAAAAEAVKKAAEEEARRKEEEGRESTGGRYAPKKYGEDETYYTKSKDGTIKRYFINEIECSEEDYDKFDDLSQLIFNPDYRFFAPKTAIERVRDVKVASAEGIHTYYYVDGIPATEAAALSIKSGAEDVVKFNGVCTTTAELDWYKNYTKNEISLTAATSTSDRTREDSSTPSEEETSRTEERMEDELDDFLYGMARGIEAESGDVYKDEVRRGEEFRKLVGGAEHVDEEKIKKYIKKRYKMRDESEARDFMKLVGGAETNNTGFEKYNEKKNDRDARNTLNNMARGIDTNGVIESQRSVRVNKKKLFDKYLDQASNQREIENILKNMALGLDGDETTSDEILEPIYDFDKDYYEKEGAPAIMGYYFDDDRATSSTKTPKEEKKAHTGTTKQASLDDFGTEEEKADEFDTETKGSMRVSIDVPEGTDLSDTEVKFSKKKKEYYGPKRMGEFPEKIVDDKVKCTSKGVEKRAVGLVADIVRDHFVDKYKKSVKYLVDARKHEESSREYQDNFNKSIENGVESNIAAVISDLLENPVDVKVKHPELLDESTYEVNKEICNDLMKVANSLVDKALKFREDNYSVTGPKTTAVTFDEYIKSLGGKERVKAALDEKYITPILNNGYFRIQGITNSKPVEKSYE